MKKVIIDPRSSYAYGSFYMYGLEVLVGKRNISYNLKPFADLTDFDNGLKFIIIEDGVTTKYFIHTNDSYKLSENNYNWCDVYGCVNANFTHYPKAFYPKLVSLAPSFGIRIDQSILHVLFNAGIQLISTWSYVLNRKEYNQSTHKEESNKLRNIKHYFTRRIKAWKDRLPLSEYENTDTSKDNYIFFLSTLWYSDEWNKNDEGVNLRRAHFIRACKKILGDKFEGGLLGDAYSSNAIFEDVFVTQRETFASWIEKTKKVH